MSYWVGPLLKVVQSWLGQINNVDVGLVCNVICISGVRTVTNRYSYDNSFAVFTVGRIDYVVA